MSMKRVFTFLFSALMATTAFAQAADYEDRIINGDAEGEDLQCFWAHDFNVSDNVPARIEVDPTDENNHVFVVSSVGDSGDDWAAQFFIRVDPKIEGGDKIRLTMRIRADKAADVSTQAHNEPGDYNFYQMFGNVKFTTEWQTVTLTATLSDNAAYGENNTKDSEGAKEMHTVAFNLFVLKEDNNYYFDDIKLEVQPAAPPSGFTGWFELVRNGDLSTDVVTNFVSRDADAMGEGWVDDQNTQGELARLNPETPAKIITDKEGKPAIVVKTCAPTYWKTVNDDGTMSDPRIVYPDGTDCVLYDWQAQFFVTSNHEFTTAGQKIKFKMEARADVPCTIQSQIHAAPGDYIFYQLFGDINLTTEWQTFEFEKELTGDQISGSSGKLARTVAFNLNPYKDSDNKIYFRNLSMCCNKADVTTETRTLGTGDFYLPVPKSPDASIEVPIDLSQAVAVLGVDDFAKFVTGDNVKINADEKGTLTYSLSPETGFYINEKGIFDETNGNICVEVNTEDIKDNTANFIITNVGKKDFADGTQVKTRFCFVMGDWYYVYNVTFVDTTAFEGLAGITTITADKQSNGAIYDLMGRKVNSPAKGLYIKDGKKFLLK